MKVSVLFISLLLCTSTFAQKVLVFAPHPGDDVLGCGGSIIRHVRNSDQVSTIYLASGVGPSPEEDPARELRRELGARQACHIMGVKQMQFLRLPHGFVLVDRATVMIVRNIIDRERPDIIYTTNFKETTRDGEAAPRLVFEAVRDIHSSDSSYAPVLRLSEICGPILRPKYYEAITDVMGLKKDALLSVCSSRSTHAIIGLNRYRCGMWGEVYGVPNGYAEAFDEFNDWEG